MFELGELIKAAILGVIEGITEFLPISSTGHLIVGTELLQFQHNLGGTFEIFIQLGAVLAVVWFYRNELIRQVRAVSSDTNVRHFWAAIVVACIPAAIMGFLLRDWIKAVLFTPVVVALSLIIGGILLIIIERKGAGRADLAPEDDSNELTRISLRQAFLIGLAQMVALIPGVSRSAASIIGAMQTGLNRRMATEFSFFLAIPTLGGATIADLIFNLDELATGDLIYLLVGFVMSGVVAWLSIRWLLQYVSRNNFIGFGVYRILAGTFLLILAAIGAI